MPSYRLLKALPEVLSYRGGAQLTLHRGDRMSSGHVISYRKYGSATEAVIYDGLSAEDAERMMKLSFYLSDGTPGDRVMKSLVERGYAERLD